MRKIVVILSSLAFAMTTIAISGSTASATDFNTLYTNHSPYTHYRSTDGSYACADSQQIISAAYVKLYDITNGAPPRDIGAIQLMRSNRCQTYWSRLIVYREADAQFVTYNFKEMERFYKGSSVDSWNMTLGGGTFWTTVMVYAPSSTVTFDAYTAAAANHPTIINGHEFVAQGATARLR